MNDPSLLSIKEKAHAKINKFCLEKENNSSKLFPKNQLLRILGGIQNLPFG